jgi:hypothetical protein
MRRNSHKLRPGGAGNLAGYPPILALHRSCTTPGRETKLEVIMRNSLAILIGTLCAAGTLQAASAAQSASTTKDQVSAAPAQQHEVVMTAKWGFEAPNLFPLDPQEVQSYGGTTRPGPRNRHLSASRGGLVTAAERSGLPGRE